MLFLDKDMRITESGYGQPGMFNISGRYIPRLDAYTLREFGVGGFSIGELPSHSTHLLGEFNNKLIYRYGETVGWNTHSIGTLRNFLRMGGMDKEAAEEICGGYPQCYASVTYKNQYFTSKGGVLVVGKERGDFYDKIYYPGDKIPPGKYQLIAVDEFELRNLGIVPRKRLYQHDIHDVHKFYFNSAAINIDYYEEI